MAVATKYTISQPFEAPRDVVDGYRSVTEHSHPSIYTSDYDNSDFSTKSSFHVEDTPKPLTTRECVESFDDSVEKARQALHQSFAGTGGAAEALRPKLTIDMTRKNIAQIPSEVVSIIRQDVERLHLSYNQLRSISPDFCTCSALRYLNLRGNKFCEIPHAIFALGGLEILDVSRNDLTSIPDEISNLKVLRVFAFRLNNIRDLPLSMGTIPPLRMLRLEGNPWNAEIESILRDADASYSPTAPGHPTETERDQHQTAMILDHLRKKQATIDGYNDSPLETPRALSRFPVNPNDSGYTTNGSEGSRSPGLLKSRSHSRATSNQYNATQNGPPRRPGLAPLALNNERNRSHSESVLQATQNKSKRMGIIPKKKPELEVLDESQTHRNSFHLRGQSHSSALRNMMRAGERSPSDEANRHSGQKGTFFRRLSSVPEQKQSVEKADNIIESAKSILYSLHSMQPYLASVVALARENKSRRSSLERYHHQASVQLEHLDQSLHDLEHMMSKGKGKSTQKAARKTVCRATHASIAIFIQIAGILMQNITHLVAFGDRRYIRGLMVVLWGSLIEERNARRKLVPASSPQDTLGTLRSASQLSGRVLRDDALTPTQDYPKPERRARNGSVSQHPFNQTNLAAIVNSRPPTSHSNFSSRATSRSSSRTGWYHPPSATSGINTPRSGESFGANLLPRSRAGSVSVKPERARQAQYEQDQFEKIYTTLTKAVDQGILALKQLQPRFIREVDEAQNPWVAPEIRNSWHDIMKRSRTCGEMSEALRLRLHSFKLNDPSTRNSTDLWRLVTSFTQSYTDLVTTLKDNRSLVRDVNSFLRPVHALVGEAAILIAQSPWEKLSKESGPISRVTSRAPTPVQGYPPPALYTQMMPPPIPHPSMQTHQHYQHRRPNGSNGSATGSVSSPYNTSIPATPMSAALGPAAQATVPKTPASGSGSLAGMFEGNVFQRADNLLSHGQTMFRRPSGAP